MNATASQKEKPRTPALLQQTGSRRAATPGLHWRAQGCVQSCTSGLLHTPPLQQGTDVCKRPRGTEATHLGMIHLQTSVITSKTCHSLACGPASPTAPLSRGSALRRGSDPRTAGLIENPAHNRATAAGDQNGDSAAPPRRALDGQAPSTATRPRWGWRAFLGRTARRP